MTDQFLAEIRIFPFNYAPTGWALCNGQLLPLSQNVALFSLLGTVYGGDGKSTFALPNLQGAAAMHPGEGSGLTARTPGEQGGAQSVTLLTSEIPSHAHRAMATNERGDSALPAGNLPAMAVDDHPYRATGTATQMAVPAAAVTGGGIPHNNLMPSLALHFCIALQGIFPHRP